MMGTIDEIDTDVENDNNEKNCILRLEDWIENTICTCCCPSWNSKNEFLFSQVQVLSVLIIAVVGDRWEPSYDRNLNHSMLMFWALHGILLIATVFTWQHKPNRQRADDSADEPAGVVKINLLSREQTEEWKGWMQFSFIMYHYYRAWSAYNFIRVFVSSYVWMTGFGNFLYFDKKKDFSLERIVSMCIRINYFPLLLSWATGVSLDLYYVVPLHTWGFFMTYITCRLALFFEECFRISYWPSRIFAIQISIMAHVVGFYETSMVNSLAFFSDEIKFRFENDKYSALIGIVCGLMMGKANQYMTWAYGNHHDGPRPIAQGFQRLFGVALIGGWYKLFGGRLEKYDYNAIHPYIFVFPMLGWLMLRNSSRYLTECHSTFLLFLGKNTLETYVLQFHLFMNHSVQHIPIIIPGAGDDGDEVLKILNMLLTGVVFVRVAVWARSITISTQNSVVELVKSFRSSNSHEYSPARIEEDIQVELHNTGTNDIPDSMKV